jgi:hypothetical protein
MAPKFRKITPTSNAKQPRPWGNFVEPVFAFARIFDQIPDRFTGLLDPREPVAPPSGVIELGQTCAVRNPHKHVIMRYTFFCEFDDPLIGEIDTASTTVNPQPLHTLRNMVTDPPDARPVSERNEYRVLPKPFTCEILPALIGRGYHDTAHSPNATNFVHLVQLRGDAKRSLCSGCYLSDKPRGQRIRSIHFPSPSASTNTRRAPARPPRRPGAGALLTPCPGSGRGPIRRS